MAPHIRRGNASRSKVRVPVQHVFAHQKGAMGLFIRTIGLARAKVKIGIANITYNMSRLVWHERRRALAQPGRPDAERRADWRGVRQDISAR
jgi:transposase, IS5 family